MNMMNPIPMKWSRLWLLGIALCFFCGIEVGFAQKATFQTKDGRKSIQKDKKDANKSKLKQQKSALEFNRRARVLPSPEELNKAWDKLSEQDRMRMLKEIMLSSEANSPHQKFVESKVGAIKMQQIKKEAVAEEKAKVRETKVDTERQKLLERKRAYYEKKFGTKKDEAVKEEVKPGDKAADLAKQRAESMLKEKVKPEELKDGKKHSGENETMHPDPIMAEKLGQIARKTKDGSSNSIVNSKKDNSALEGKSSLIQDIDANGTVHLELEPGVSYNLKKLLQLSDTKISVGNKADNIKARHEFQVKKTKNPVTGRVPEGIEKRALAYAKSTLANNTQTYSPNIGIPFAAGDQTSPWAKRGPYNVGGRTRALAYDVRNENIILAGGVSGGMWRTTDQGATWSKVTSPNDLASVSDVAQDTRAGNEDTWYYSTGERIGNSASANFSANFVGDGIFKSTDNGATWNQLLATVSGTPQNDSDPFDITWELEVNPVNGDVYAATFDGIFRSQDGGASFSLVLDASFDSKSHIEISSAGVMYVAIGDDATNEGIYRSTTGNLGDWTNITDGAFPTGIDRTVMAIAPSNEDIVYIFASTPGFFGHTSYIWKYTYTSGDGSGAGGTWEDRSANLPAFGGNVGNLNIQTGYDMFVRVHPTDPDMVFLAGTNLYRSTDGYATDTNTDWIAGYSPLNDISLYTNNHPDQHRLVFLGSDPNKAINATDGGLHMTDDITVNDGSTEEVTWSSLNNGYYTTQPYAASIGPGDRIMAGFQDNSTWFEQTSDSTAAWTDIFGGDGAYNAFNDDGTLRYVSSQGGNMFRLDFTDADSDVPLSFTGVAPSGGSQFITPFVRDPNNEDVMYFAGSSGLWRNNNMSNATTTVGWSNLGGSGDITYIAVSSLPSDIVYFGTGSAGVFRVDDADGNATITNVTGGNMPAGAYVAGIDVDSYDADHVVVTLSNYEIPSVFETRDGGNTWTDVSGNLEENPDGSGAGPSVQSVAIVGDEDIYIVGTSTGLYTTSSLNGASTVWSWVAEVGNVPVPHITRRNSDGLVLVSSHGNGLWSGNFETSEPRILVSNSIPDVSVKQDAPDVVLDLSNVFTSTVPEPLTLFVSANTNTGIVTTSLVGTDLTLSFVAGQTGDATITIDANDTGAGFASTSFDVTVSPVINTYPYVESFEAGAGGWEAGGSASTWELGTPADDDIIGASDGTQAWTTGLTVDYNGPEQSFVVSPCFDFSALQNPVLFMDIWWESEFSWDGTVMQYSTDLGQTWQQLGTLGSGVNWYNDNTIDGLGFTGSEEGWTGRNGSGSNGYVEAFHSLDFLANEAVVQFRMVMGADGSFEDDGFAFDNVRILNVETDLGVASINMPAEAPFGASESIEVTLSNVGINDVSNFDLTLEVDGGVIATETVAGPALAGQDFDYTFTATADLSALGSHDIKVTIATADDFPPNDELEITVETVPVLASYPYIESFESGAGGWTAGGANSSWELGQPNDDDIIGASEGTEAWTTGLTADYNPSEASFVTSPYFDFSAVQNPLLFVDVWWEAGFSFDGASLQYTTDLGQTWQTVGDVGTGDNWFTGNVPAVGALGADDAAWTGANGSGSNGYVEAFHTLDFLIGEPVVRFRFVMGSTAVVEDDGFAFDFVRILDVTDDLDLADILMPDEVPASNASPVTINIANNGLNPGANFDVTFEVDGTPVATETVAGPVAVGGDLDYTFTATADLSVAGPHTIKAYLSTADDYAGNDTFEIDIDVVPVVASFPYNEGFEGGPGNWTAGGTASTWELGTPNDDIIIGASEGTQAWTTGLTANYNVNEQSFVASPYFDFSGLVNPYFFADIWFDLETSFDGVALQVTTDFGQTWDHVGTIGDGGNWYNDGTISGLGFSGSQEGWTGTGGLGSGGYIPAYIPMSNLAGESAVRFRFVLGSDFSVTDDGFAFDKLRIEDIDDDLELVDILMAPEKNYGAAENITVNIENVAANDQTNFNLTIEVDGVVAGTTTFPGPLASGDDDDFTTDFTVDLSVVGLHDIRAWLDADDFVGNDTFAITVETLPTIATFPYVESFEGGPAFWTSGGTNSSWELGQPSGAVINRASDGTNAWVTDLDGDYNLFEESFVLSPFFDFSTVVNPYIFLDLWYDIETNWEGAAMQYTIDCGETWVNLGDLTTGNEWFNLNLPNSNPFGQNVLTFTGGNGDAWSGSVADGESSEGYVPAFHELSFLVGEPSVRFRIVMGSDNVITADGLAFDRVQVIDVTDNLGINDILLPDEKNYGATEDVTVSISNDGLNDMSNFNVTVEVDGAVIGTTTVAGPLAVGNEEDFTMDFTIDLSAIGPHNVRAWLDADDFVGNDTFSVDVVTLPTISTFPYNESFEADAGFWSAGGENSSWELGQPNAAIIDEAADGTDAWVTNLTGSYNNFEESYVASPFFDFSGLVNPFVVFDIWWEIETGFDGAALQYTLDCGETWENVGALGDGNNWYNGNTPALAFSGGNGDAWTGEGVDGSDGWVSAIHGLPALAGEPSVRFRVVFGADFSVIREGFAFDNITIVDAPTEIGVIDADLNEAGKFTDSEIVTLTLENNGVQDLAANSATIFVEVDGAIVNPSGEVIDVVIPTGGTADYTLTTAIDLSTPGIHDVRAFISSLDPIAANDTLGGEILSVPILDGFPYTESFEGTDGAWYTTDANGINTWERGAPAGFVINSASDGAEAWVTDLDGPYLDSEQSFLNSPFFDFTSLQNPVVRFDLWYDTEGAFDGAALQASTDEGETWENIGVLGGDGLNWYNGNIGPTMSFSGGNGDAWNGASGGWTTVQQLVPQYAGVGCVQFRMVMGADALFFFPSNFDGVAVDNILIKEVTDDVAIVDLGMEEAGVYNATTDIKVLLKNNGINDATNFDITYTIDGGTTITETVTDVIAPGDELVYTFTAKGDLSALGNHDIDFEITTIDDLINNNTFSGSVFTLDVVPAYVENFETDPAFETGNLDEWFVFSTTNYSWQLNSGPTTSTATGPDDDVSEPGDTYVYTEASFSTEGDVSKLYTPGYDVSGFLHPTMSFWFHRFGAEMSEVEVIVHDVASNTYTSVITFTGDEQTAPGDPYTFSGYIPVDFLTGDEFSVIFKGTRQDGFNGDFAIDEFAVFDILDHDVTISDFVPVDPFVPGEEVVEIEVSNLGFQTQSNIPVAFTVNGGTPVTGVVPGPLASGESAVFVFGELVDVSAVQSYDFEIYTALANDEDLNNDTIAYNFTHPGFVTTYPYEESFEGGTSGWRSKSDIGINSWEWGMPNNGLIDGASDGDNAWVTDLDGNYQDDEQSFVYGPIFDFSTLADPVVIFDAFFDIEAGYDGASFQYSLDAGRTWQNVGELGDFTNWYNVNHPSGLPGSTPVMDWTGGNGDAWTGSTTDYITVAHEMFDLGGESQVLLRVAFSADFIFNQEGLAIDNFRIYDRTDLAHIESCGDDVLVNTDLGDDIATGVTVPQPSVLNDGPGDVLVNSWTNTDNASGDFQVGYTEVDWALFGEFFVDECFQLVQVTDDELPEIADCPDDTVYLVSSSTDSVVLDYNVDISDNLEVLTYSGDQTLISRGAVMCPQGGNGYIRIYDFAEDFGTTADRAHIAGLELGIELAQSSSGDQNATLNLYSYDTDDALDPSSFNLIFTNVVQIPDGNEFFFEIPAGITVSTDLALVVEVVTDGNFNETDYFYAASQPNQNKANNSFINTAVCGFIDLDDAGFPGYDWLMNLKVAPVVDFTGVESGVKVGQGLYEQSFNAFDLFDNEVTCEFKASVLLDSIVVSPPFNITTSSVEFSWNELLGAEEYEVFIIVSHTGDTANIISVPAGQTSLVVSPMNLDHAYNYKVRGKCGDVVTSFSNTEVFMTSPFTPIALDPTEVNTQSFFANWDANGDNPGRTAFELDISQDNFNTFLIENEILDSDLRTRFTQFGEGAYQYRIRARRIDEFSGFRIETPWSNVIAFVTPPVAPTGLTATPSPIGATGEVVLDWSDNSVVNQGYIVYKSIAGTGNFVPLLDGTGSPIVLAGNAETYTDTEVSELVSYAYYVEAFFTDGVNSASAQSNIAVSGLVSGTVDQLLESTTKVSPNPSNGIFNIRMDNEYNGDLTFELFDVAGKSIESKEYVKNGVTLLRKIDLSNKQSGVYILRISSENGFITRRLMKQ